MKRIGYDYDYTYTYKAFSEMRETIRDMQVDGRARVGDERSRGRTERFFPVSVYAEAYARSSRDESRDGSAVRRHFRTERHAPRQRSGGARRKREARSD